MSAIRYLNDEACVSSIITTIDNRLASFAVGADGALWHQWTDTTGSWSNWVSLGGILKQISVTTNKDGRIEVFGIGTDDKMWHRWQVTPAGNWSSDWATLDGQFHEVAASVNADGRLVVFGIGHDHAVWHRWQEAPGGSWNREWVSLGGTLRQLRLARTSDKRLVAFGIGTDNAVWHLWQTAAAGDWHSEWVSLGGSIDSLAVASTADRRLVIFGIGDDHAVWHRWQESPGGSWSQDWVSLGGWLRKIIASRQPNGTLQVIGIGADYETYRIAQRTDQNWGDWQLVFIRPPGSNDVGDGAPNDDTVTSQLFANAVTFSQGTPSPAIGLTDDNSRARAKELYDEAKQNFLLAVISAARGAYDVATGMANDDGAKVALGLAELAVAAIAFDSAVAKVEEAAQLVEQADEDDDTTGGRFTDIDGRPTFIDGYDHPWHRTA